MTRLIRSVESVAYHRNGVGGEGFHAVLFTATEDGRQMAATVFPLAQGETWNGRVAVLDVALLATGDVGFGSNSWRGDCFEAELRKAVEKWEKAQSRRFAHSR